MSNNCRGSNKPMDKSNIKNKGKTFDPQSWKSNNYVRSNREKLNIKKITI
jgi:hypothetical protein